MWNVWLIFHQRHSLEYSQISPQWRKAFSNIKVWLQSRWYEGKPNYVPNLNNSKATEHPISIRKGHLVTTSYRKNPTHFEMPWQIWNCLKNKCRRFQVKTNATSVTLHRLRQATWGHIWKRTVEKSQSNAFVVTTHLLVQTIWEYIWHYTVEKTQIHATNVLHIFYSRFFEDSFELTQWRRAKQTHAGCWDAWQKRLNVNSPHGGGTNAFKSPS